MLLRNDSSDPITGTIHLGIQGETTPVETALDLAPDESMSLVVSERPTVTVIDMDGSPGEDRFNWTNVPSCRIDGLPTQMITVDGDTIGIEYECKPHNE